MVASASSSGMLGWFVNFQSEATLPSVSAVSKRSSESGMATRSGETAMDCCGWKTVVDVVESGRDIDSGVIAMLEMSKVRWLVV
jgi:hypothetical protein